MEIHEEGSVDHEGGSGLRGALLTRDASQARATGRPTRPAAEHGEGTEAKGSPGALDEKAALAPAPEGVDRGGKGVSRKPGNSGHMDPGNHRGGQT